MKFVVLHLHPDGQETLVNLEHIVSFKAQDAHTLLLSPTNVVFHVKESYEAVKQLSGYKLPLNLPAKP